MATNTRWVRLNVDVFDHPMFGGEAFSKREAWIWLIAHAEPKAKTKTIKGARYNLKRGELVTSRLYLAKTWGWTDSKVRCFLQKLARQGDAQIRTEQRLKCAILTICKYDEYQSPTPKQRLDSARFEPELQPQILQDNNSTRQKKEITPVVPLDEEAKVQAKAEQAAALTGPEAPEHVSVVWDTQGRLEVFNGFRTELQDKLKGTKITLRDALDEAAGQQGLRAKSGVGLQMAVRSQVTKQVRWHKESQLKRGAPSAPPRVDQSELLIQQMREAQEYDKTLFRKREPA